MRRVNAKAVYTAIPEQIEIDVTPLTIGKSFKVSDLKFEGIKFTSPKDAVICSVVTTRVAAADEEEGAAEETEEASEAADTE